MPALAADGQKGVNTLTNVQSLSQTGMSYFYDFDDDYLGSICTLRYIDADEIISNPETDEIITHQQS